MDDERYNSLEQDEMIDDIPMTEPMDDESFIGPMPNPNPMGNMPFMYPSMMQRPTGTRSSKTMFKIILGVLLILFIGVVIFLIYTSTKKESTNPYEEDVLNDKELYDIAQSAYIAGYTYENKKQETKKEEPEKEKVDASKITKTEGTFSDSKAEVILADIGVSLLVEGTLKYSLPVLKKAAIPLAKFAVQAKNILSVSKALFKNPAAIKSLGTQLFQKLFKSTAGEIGETVSKKIGAELAENVLQTGSKELSKGASKGAAAAVKSGVGAIGKSFARLTGKLASLAGQAAAKGGIRSMFNVGKLVKGLKPSPMMLLSAVSIGLDTADVGGYGKMQTVAGFIKIKDENDKLLRETIIEIIKKTYDDAEAERKKQIANKEIDEKDNPPIVFDPNDIDIPPIINPLNDISAEEEEKFFDAILTKILDPANKNALAIPLQKAIENDLKTGEIQASDVERVGEKEYKIKNEDILARYAMLIRSDQIINYFYEELCKSKEGVLTKDGTCTYSKEKCHSLYPWPLPEPKKDKDGNEIDDPNAPAYSEFSNGACRMALPLIRTSCDENKLKYNYETGICEITKGYCESKGGEWRMNDEINQMDCLIPMEQQFAEFIFGTTITRGLKQLFDPEQRESCGVDGPFKIRGKCVDLPNGKTDVGVQPRIWDCNDTSAQQFFYDTRSKSIFSMKDYKKCFDTVGGTLNEGEKIQLAECAKKDSQQFIYDKKTKLLVARKDKKKCIGISENRFVSGNQNWKETDNPKDPACMKNWTYYDTNGQFVIKNNIPNIVSAKDYHVWSIEKGMMKNMNYNKCLSQDFNTGEVSVQPCDPLSQNQQWVYNPTDKTIKQSQSEGLFGIEYKKNSFWGIITSSAFARKPTPTDKKYEWDITADGQIISITDNKKCLAVDSDGTKVVLADCKEGDIKSWCATKREGPPPNDTRLELVMCDVKDKNQQFDLKRNMLADNGFSCSTWKVATCPPGYRNDGLICTRDASTKSSDFGLGPYESADCPPGYWNNGTTCHHVTLWRGNGRDDVFYDGFKTCAEEDGDGDRNNCEKWGLRVYPKCDYLAKKLGYAHADKWTNDACCYCSPEWGYKSFTYSEAAECPPKKNSDGTLLDPEKAKHYTKRSAALCYVDCEKEYGEDYGNSGVTCYRHPHSTGTSTMKCDPDTEVQGSGISGGRCHPKICPPSYYPQGAMTSIKGKARMGGFGMSMKEIQEEEDKNMYMATPNTTGGECIRGKRRSVSLSLDYKADEDDTIGMPS